MGDLHGEVLEAGVGTGRNLKYYPSHVKLTALDFSPAMLRHASRRCSGAACSVRLLQDDACDMTAIESGRYDWVVATFLCCVLPAGLQTQAIAQFERVLKPGGRFRLLEMVYSKDPALRRRQDFFAPFVEKVYGARFDRDTHRHLLNHAGLKITCAELHKARYVPADRRGEDRIKEGGGGTALLLPSSAVDPNLEWQPYCLPRLEPGWSSSLSLPRF